MELFIIRCGQRDYTKRLRKMLLFIFFTPLKSTFFKAQRFTLYINTSLPLTKKMVAFAHCALIAKSVQPLWVSCGVTTPVNILLHKSHLTTVVICCSLWWIVEKLKKQNTTEKKKEEKEVVITCNTVNNNSSFLNKGVAHCPEKKKQSNPKKIQPKIMWQQ